MKKELKRKIGIAMEGCTWEEAREIGVDILGKCLAFYLNVYDHNDLEKMTEDICKRGDKWLKEENGAFVIAMARKAPEFDKVLKEFRKKQKKQQGGKE